MNKTVKILAIILLAIVLVTFSTNVFAAELNPSGVTPDFSGDATGLNNMAKKIAGMLRNIAVIASVIIIMILGVKYMLGSVEEKADYKKSFVPLIVGIILVVAATSIASFIFNMAR